MVWCRIELTFRGELKAIAPAFLLQVSVHGLNQARSKRAPVNVADRCRQRIGGIGTHGAAQAQQCTYHLLHLLFGRTPISNHRDFDFRGRVFSDAQLMFRCCQESDTARLSELQGTLHVA